MARAKRTFSPQFREEAVKLVIEGSRPIVAVARELGIGDGTLGNWVAAYRRKHAGEEPTLNVSERERLRQLEREARELRMENEFLKKAAAYFPGIIGERHVRVHRRRVRNVIEERQPRHAVDRANVHVEWRLPIRILRLAEQA